MITKYSTTQSRKAGFTRPSKKLNLMHNKNVTLFIQCLIDCLYPDVGEAVVHIFQKLGLTIIYPPDQTCCGQPAFNSGYKKEAKVAAKRFIRIFENADSIVCPSGSCVNMVRNHYPQLFRNDRKWFRRALSLSKKIFELTEYLVDILGVEDIGAGYHGKITYHDSCHLLYGIGISNQPRKLIRSVKGVQFIEMKDSDRCCGFGGAFSIKYPEISTAILEEKVKNIIDSGADAVVGCDIGCLMNIHGMLSRKGSPIKVMHIARLLAG